MLAHQVALKNEKTKKRNFSKILKANKPLKNKNLPFSQMQYMEIIERQKQQFGLTITENLQDGE